MWVYTVQYLLRWILWTLDLLGKNLRFSGTQVDPGSLSIAMYTLLVRRWPSLQSVKLTIKIGRKYMYEFLDMQVAYNFRKIGISNRPGETNIVVFLSRCV